MRWNILNDVLFIGICALKKVFIIKIFTTSEFYDSYTVVPYVALAYILKGPYMIFLMGIIMKNKVHWQLYLETIAAFANILLNFALIPMIGREGAALSTLFC